MTALRIPHGLKLGQNAGEALVAAGGPVMPGRAWLAGLQPLARSRPQNQVCRLKDDKTPSVPLLASELRPEHRQQVRTRRQKQLSRIVLNVRAVMDLRSQRLQQVGKRPVRARSHCAADLLPLPMSRRLVRQNQILHLRALPQSPRQCLGAAPQLRMRRISELTHVPQCSPRLFPLSNGADS